MVKEEKCKKLEEENANLISDIKRLQAEFDNYRKREEKLSKERIANANSSLIKELLQVVDNFELAIKSSNDSKGIELIYGQLITILEEKGLKKMNALGQKFNPELHEAMLVENNEQEKDTIIEVFQEGYYFKDKVLRHAKVKLSGGQK